MAAKISPGLSCGLCGDERAETFCEECKDKLCDTCQAAHRIDLETKDHHVTAIENVQLSVLNVCCSDCEKIAEKFCPTCNVCLCTQCSDNHHKLSNILPKHGDVASFGQTSSLDNNQNQPLCSQGLSMKPDKTESNEAAPFHGSSQGFNKTSASVFSKDAQTMMVGEEKIDILCDLCKVEKALSFCKECQKNFGNICEKAHRKQKKSINHHISKIENSKLSNLNEICSVCQCQSLKFCQTCNASLCSKCAEYHHQLSDTLIKAKQYLYASHKVADSTNELESVSENNSVQLSSDVLDSDDDKPYPDTDKTPTQRSSTDAIEKTSSKLDLNLSKKTKKDKLKKNRPGQPSATKTFFDKVQLKWKGVNNLGKDQFYRVHITNTQTNESTYKDCVSNQSDISGLKPSTKYVFHVQLINADGVGSKYSKPSTIVKTQAFFAEQLSKKSVRVQTDENGPAKFYLPMTAQRTSKDKSAGTRKYQFGQSGKKHFNEKTIMLVGATGTGKSTLVDGIINYVLGVRLDDPFRFTVMQEDDTLRQKNQAKSQTDLVTCYTFNPQTGTRLEYILHVIDTPGFGDTRGLERDAETVKQIRELFESTEEDGIQTIDAVCFLLKAPDSRLTATQAYIFNAIMSLFGKDIDGNICTFITFADGSYPPVLSAVKASNLPFGENFTFNNSALFSDSTNPMTSMFWNMCLCSFEEVFTYLNKLQPKSIQLSKEVLQERRCLQTTCENLQGRIDAGLSTIAMLNTEIKLFTENQDEIKRNENFEYEVDEIKTIQEDLPPGIHVTNCLTCNRTCHKVCIYADDKDKKKCSAMGFSGKCRQCPQKCIWSQHRNAPYRIGFLTERVKKTYDDMKKKYQDAVGNTQTLEEVIHEMERELESQSVEIENMVEKMRKCINRLKEIALRPSPLNTIDLIDQMIQKEKDEAKEGFQDRIDALARIRKNADVGTNVNLFKKKEFDVKELIHGSSISLNKPASANNEKNNEMDYLLFETTCLI